MKSYHFLSLMLPLAGCGPAPVTASGVGVDEWTPAPLPPTEGSPEDEEEDDEDEGGGDEGGDSLDGGFIPSDDFQSAKARAIEAFERVYLTNILRKCGGIVSRASEYSGLSERNFHEKLKRYNISAKAFRNPGTVPKSVAD